MQILPIEIRVFSKVFYIILSSIGSKTPPHFASLSQPSARIYHQWSHLKSHVAQSNSKISADLENSASGQGNYGSVGKSWKDWPGPWGETDPWWGRWRAPVAPAPFVAHINKPISKPELPPAWRGGTSPGTTTSHWEVGGLKPVHLLTKGLKADKLLCVHSCPQLLGPGRSLMPSSSSSQHSKLSALVTGWIQDVVCVTWLKTNTKCYQQPKRGLPTPKQAIPGGVWSCKIIVTSSNTELAFSC